MLLIDAKLIRERRRPLSAHDIEQRCAGGIGNITDVFAGELKPQVVFRKQDLSNTSEVRRFVVTHPKELGQSESGQHRIGDRCDDRFLSDECVDGIDLSLASLVAPDQCGTNDLIGRIEQDQPMHLAGEPDAADIFA